MEAPVVWKALPLEDIQANILSSHAREHAWCLFVRLAGSMQDSRRLISEFVSNPVIGITSAAVQLFDSIKRKLDPTYDGGIVTCFFLSAEGYKVLEVQDTEIPSDPSFRSGMKDRKISDSLNDPHVERWKARGYHEPIHAMILLAGNNILELDSRKDKVLAHFKKYGGELLFIEKGNKLRYNNSTYGVEHFGFRDDITDIKFWDKDYRIHSKNLALVLNKESPNAYGSYLVFRKLEQNVKAFRRKANRLRRWLGYSPDELEEVEARLIGRYRDGRPLVMGKGTYSEEQESFHFNGDRDGEICPLHAHIRKVNPLKNVPGSVSPQVVRRGIPYGERMRKDLSDSPEKGVGLLFMSYQRSIQNQFEYILKGWVNNPGFPKNGNKAPGIDPIIGRMHGRQQQWWTAKDKGSGKRQISFDFRDVVSLMGGEYFYAPSISFLKKLSDQTVAPPVTGRDFPPGIIEGPVVYTPPEPGIAIPENPPVSPTDYEKKKAFIYRTHSILAQKRGRYPRK